MSEIYSKYLSLNESKSADGVNNSDKKSTRKKLNESKGDIRTIEKEFKNRVGLEFDDVVEDIRSSNKGWEFFCGSYTDEVDSLVSLIEDLISDGEIGKYEVTLDYGKGRTCWIYLDEVEDDEDEWEDDENLEESKKKVSFKNKKKLSESNENVLKVLKNMYDENELKDGVSLKYNKKEKSYFVKTDGGAEYSLNTNDLDDALMKFYKKEIISDREAKRNFEFFKNQLGESKKKAIKEWRRNISGYSEISDEEVKKYQSELDEIGDKLEKLGISVEKVGQVNVEEFEGSDDYFTEEAWGHIELSKPIKDEDEFEKICDIVEPYIDNRLSDVKDIGGVGSIQLYITFKVVDRFWDDEELEESSRKKSRFYKKILGEKDSKTFNKAFKDFEHLVREVSKEVGADFKELWVRNDYDGVVVAEFGDKTPSGRVDNIKKVLDDDIRVEKITKRMDGNALVIQFNKKYRNLEESIKNRKNRIFKKDGILESRKIRIIGKKLCEDIAKAKDFDEALYTLRDAIVSMGDGIGAEIDSLWVANGEDGKIVLDFKDNNNPKNVDMFKKALESYNFIENVEKKSDDRLIIYFKDEFKERFDESKDDMRKKISLFKSRNNTIKESSKRKSFKEYKKLNEAHDCKVLRISGLKPFLKKAFKELDVDESSETYYAKQDLGVRVRKKKNIRGDIFLRAVFFSDEGDVLIDAEDYNDLIFYMDNQYCEELNWLI